MDLSQREAGGFEDFSDGIYSEPQSFKGMGPEEREAVICTAEDQREGSEVAIANFDPCSRLFSSGSISQHHRDLPVRSNPEAGQKRGWELAECGSGVHKAFDGDRRLIAGSRGTDMNLH